MLIFIQSRFTFSWIFTFMLLLIFFLPQEIIDLTDDTCCYDAHHFCDDEIQTKSKSKEVKLLIKNESQGCKNTEALTGNQY